jgi:hypothetical protein
MAINVTISRGYAWRMILIGATCVVLGAWGVYDYAVDIPRRQQLHERVALLEQCRDALESEQAAGALTPAAQTAVEAVTAETERVITRELGEAVDLRQAPLTAQQNAKLQQQLAQNKSSGDADWLRLLSGIARGLYAERGLPLTELAYPVAHEAHNATQLVLDEIGQVSAPGKYDRLTQWAFIACLPCAVYFFWMYFAAGRRRYALDDEGTLHTPAGAWKATEIADIDMSRWMAKSIAWPVHTEGARVKLDDYKYKGLHRIVGAIASRLHPDEWDPDASPAEQAETPPDAPADRDAEPGEDARGLSESAAGTDGR